MSSGGGFLNYFNDDGGVGTRDTLSFSELLQTLMLTQMMLYQLRQSINLNATIVDAIGGKNAVRTISADVGASELLRLKLITKI